MDGSAPILCAEVDVMECDRWGVCEPVVVIGKRSGEMTATMVDDDGAFVASGMRTAS